MTQTQQSRKSWISACKAQLEANNVEAEMALDIAESLADSEARTHGDNPERWYSPVMAADDEMSYWGD